MATPKKRVIKQPDGTKPKVRKPRAVRTKKAVMPAPAYAQPAPPQPQQEHARSGNVQLKRIVRILSWPIRWPLVLLWREKWRLICLLLLAASILAVPSESARQSTADVRFNADPAHMELIPARDVALVFGAGVLPDHTPSEYLKHRIETAVDLYKAGRVKTILMSGDNRSAHYDEPTVMKAYAVNLGVDPAVIALDYAGFNTYDTCYRAHAIFGVTSATVVTQGYHLPRAVMTCLQTGIDTIGVAAKHTGRDWTVAYIIREHISTAKAYVQTAMKAKPTLLGKTESL